MQFRLKQTNKLNHKLKLTPQLKLAINLLQLPLLRLKYFLNKQVEENPLLSVIENPDRIFNTKGTLYDQNYRESLIQAPYTLGEHLLRQLQMFTNSEDDYKIGESIIGNIDNDGYLRYPLEDIATNLNTQPSKVKKVLSLIRNFDPIGVGARDLRECLLIQIKAKGRESYPAAKIIDKYLTFLEKKRFKYIAEKLGASMEEIKESMKEIAQLEPKPGRSFSQENAVQLIPDAILKKQKDHYEIILNNWELPYITINDKYKKMITQKETTGDTKEYLRDRLNAARSLINALNKRYYTLQKVIEAIIYFQKDFLDNGESGFKPMTLSQIAKMVGRHKSTISRAISNKYIETQHGIFELRYFLNSGVKQKSGGFFSSKTIKSKIKNLIKNENKNNPLTDQKIAEHFKQEGISVSRRAITKYRNQFKILSSKSR